MLNFVWPFRSSKSVNFWHPDSSYDCLLSKVSGEIEFLMRPILSTNNLCFVTSIMISSSHKRVELRTWLHLCRETFQKRTCMRCRKIDTSKFMQGDWLKPQFSTIKGNDDLIHVGRYLRNSRVGIVFDLFEFRARPNTAISEAKIVYLLVVWQTLKWGRIGSSICFDLFTGYVLKTRKNSKTLATWLILKIIVLLFKLRKPQF